MQQSANGVNGVSKDSESSWKVGLLNYQRKYLTAEKFGNEINVNGQSLKKNQIFTLVQDVHDAKTVFVYIRGHTGRYLTSDKRGNVTCDAEEPGPTEKFMVEYEAAFPSRWSFKNQAYNNYLGGNDENLKCFAQKVSSTEKWTVQLSIHPQVHLYNVNRKRYAHVFDDQLQVSQTIPWGAKSLVFLVFDKEKSVYSLKTFDDRYLLSTGELSRQPCEESKFTLEIHSGQNAAAGLAFRDRNGCYLMGVGSTATMKSRNKTVGKDELFTLEDTHPQVVMYASNNGKKVSIKQGVDVSANQEGEEDTDKEIFQMEYQAHKEKWAFRTVDNKYWAEKDGGIQANMTEIGNCEEALFEVEWQEDGSMALRAHNNCYVYNKPTGSLVAGSEAVDSKEKFKVRITNRPLLVLKSDHGFVGLKGNDIVCNRTAFDVIQVEDAPREPGTYFFKASNGRYWSVAADGSVVATDNSSEKSKFRIQVRDNRKLNIRAVSHENNFFKGEQNGLFRAIGQDGGDANVQWEY